MEKYHFFVKSKLADRNFNGILRQKGVVNATSIDFSSNDFLGYSKTGILRNKINELKKDLDLSSVGSTGSRLLTGNSKYIEQVESDFSTFIGCEASLLFNSGYMANLAILSVLGDRQSMFLYDENIHASLKEGMRVSFASKFPFKHNDLFDLERLLVQNYRKHERVYVITEGLFSMDGDIPDFGSLLEICQKYDAALIIDEAHALGTIGENQLGFAFDYRQHPNIFARIYPLGKAAGTHGSFVCGSVDLINFLVNYSRPFIYTTAPAIDQVVSIHAVIALMRERRNFDALQDNIVHYIRILSSKKSDFFSVNSSPIQYFKHNDICNLKEKVVNLNSIGVSVFPIFAPTIKKGEERIRIILHSYNSVEEIDILFKGFE